ncbi:hypothetical protein ACROYT_G021754 [Oculina patagonica]
MSSGWIHHQFPELLCTGRHLEREQEDDQKRPGDGQLKKRCGQAESAGENCGRRQRTDSGGGLRQSASLFMYADDHQIYANDNDIQKAAQTLRRETEAVSQWYKENLLQANPQKYQILTLDPQPSKRTPEYALKMEFDGHEVKSSEYLKILGVTIDNKLTFSEHISDICKKTSCKPSEP